MMQRWSAQTIAFLRDAADYGEYHQQLAAHLLPYLPRDGHICDAGCGTGDLSLELAKHCRRVTAVDQSEAAIHALKKRGCPENLQPICADIFLMQAHYDAMVFCYFGRISEVLSLARQQCGGTVIFAKRNCNEHRFSVGKAPYQHFTQNTADLLRENRIPFQRESLSLEFGQPFRSMEAALEFFRLYNRSEQDVSASVIAPRLVETEQSEFPLYLPMKREMELFIFQAGEARSI